ncbi:CPBP family intramembrane glutamic endopeptidase [Flavobacterium sp. 5]|uniref:CPBP family intramembrane glutamic endopeptidase n=1 Tax=Flavobacterium sp. 5 TaxID=2035199 RepID=UPI000C2C113E|nr:CPBP family intramembrane glutamic endopeptidase [Flavobacterium sp. 5]PKB16635.1 CAAX prenyl protease-like protein [Flavobacterium sp. 5]
MDTLLISRKQVWKTLILFLSILIILSAICYYAIIKLNPTSIYVGALMMCPALSAFITLKIIKRPISSLPWELKKIKYLRLSYLVPTIYISIAYILIWIFGFGSLFNQNTVVEWSNELGIKEFNSFFVILLMVLLLATVGVVKNIGSTLGEEIGWRGFFIFELRKIFSFGGVSIISGLIWSLWHWPLIFLIYKGSNDILIHIVSFTVMIIGMSVILTYYTYKSNSLWPAALYHSVHNIYIQKIFTPLTSTNEISKFWIDEFGIMLPIITTIFAIYFWYKAKTENL